MWVVRWFVRWIMMMFDPPIVVITVKEKKKELW